MALPANLSTVTVTGRYIDATGAGVRGSVTFTLNTTLIDAAASTFIVPTEYTVPLDSLGQFSVSLPATNDTDVSPTGWVWGITENFDNGRSFSVALPTSYTTVDLSTLAPALPSPSATYSYVLTSAVGAPSGVAPLNSSSKVPTANIPTLDATTFLTSGAAVNGTVLTANGSGGVTFATSSAAANVDYSPSFLLMGA